MYTVGMKPLKTRFIAFHSSSVMVKGIFLGHPLKPYAPEISRGDLSYKCSLMTVSSRSIVSPVCGKISPVANHACSLFPVALRMLNDVHFPWRCLEPHLKSHISSRLSTTALMPAIDGTIFLSCNNWLEERKSLPLSYCVPQVGNCPGWENTAILATSNNHGKMQHAGCTQVDQLGHNQSVPAERN